jgi:hypothetical protein
MEDFRDVTNPIAGPAQQFFGIQKFCVVILIRREEPMEITGEN